jgi:hypothetical protein
MKARQQWGKGGKPCQARAALRWTHHGILQCGHMTVFQAFRPASSLVLPSSALFSGLRRIHQDPSIHQSITRDLGLAKFAI